MTETTEVGGPDRGGALGRWPQLAFATAAVALVAVTVGYHLLAAKAGWTDYRDQHLGTALEYAKGRIDLMRPVIVGFNAGNTPTPQELPLWQATAALLFKLFGPWFGWANVASLLYGMATLWPLYQLARAHAGEAAAWWTLLFFLAQPLVVRFSGLGGTDGSCLTFMVWFVYFADGMLRTGQVRWFWPAAVFGALSAVTKAPFFFCAGLATFFLLLAQGRRSARRWAMLAGAGAIATGVFMLWNRYRYPVMARAEFPFVDLLVSGGADSGESMRQWYFGDWHYRLNPANWLKGGWRFLNADLGSFALAGPLLWGLVRSKCALGRLWFLAGLTTTLVFTHLVLHHHNYYLMFSPAVALLCGVAAQRLQARLGPTRPAASVLAIWSACGVLLLCMVQGLIGLKVVLDADPYPHRIAQLIRQHTSADDKLLIQGGGWGEQLILSGRQGLCIWTTEFLEKPENLARIRQLGFTKLVMISESPLLAALQQTNPRQADRPRDTYPQYLTPVAKSWKTDLETEDILIKDIPGAARTP